MATFTIALSIFFLLGEGNASIQDHCTDISYWDEIKYETTTKQCCDTKLEQVCTNKSEQICQDVLELECEVVAWGECQSTPTNTLGTKCNVKINEFAHQNCEEVTASVAHTKKVPQCKQITKNNCVTDWQVDENGNKVWAGTETCTPVTWEECDIVEKTVEFPTVKTHCDVDSHIKWAEFVDATTNIIGLESKCEVKKAVNCKNIVVNKCAPVVWEECKMVPREECFAKVIHTPSQEKIHQKKCLTGDNTAHLDQIPPRNQLLQSHDFTSDLWDLRIEDDAKNIIRAIGGLKNLLDGRVAAGNVFGNRVESTQDCNTEGCRIIQSVRALEGLTQLMSFELFKIQNGSVELTENEKLLIDQMKKATTYLTKSCRTQNSCESKEILKFAEDLHSKYEAIDKISLDFSTSFIEEKNNLQTSIFTSEFFLKQEQKPFKACTTTCEKDEKCVEDRCLKKCQVTDLENLDTSQPLWILNDCYCAVNGGEICPKLKDFKTDCQGGGNICEINYGCMKNICPLIPWDIFIG